MAQKLTTPPFATTVLNTLKQLNIHTHEDLQTVGAVKAFLLLQAAGLTVTRSVLWRLQAACCGTLPNDAEKQNLLSALRCHPPVAIFPALSEMEKYMHAALTQAKLAATAGEVPVGAVVVHNGEIIAQAHNLCVSNHSVSHHAEIRALELAGKQLGSYRLDNCDVYVTLEPCAMCASALIQARIQRVIFAAHEPKTGAAGSVIHLFENKILNQHTAIHGGVLAEESRQLLQSFFTQRRLPEKHLSANDQCEHGKR